MKSKVSFAKSEKMVVARSCLRLLTIMLLTSSYNVAFCQCLATSTSECVSSPWSGARTLPNSEVEMTSLRENTPETGDTDFEKHTILSEIPFIGTITQFSYPCFQYVCECPCMCGSTCLCAVNPTPGCNGVPSEYDGPAAVCNFTDEITQNRGSLGNMKPREEKTTTQRSPSTCSVVQGLSYTAPGGSSVNFTLPIGDGLCFQLLNAACGCVGSDSKPCSCSGAPAIVSCDIPIHSAANLTYTSSKTACESSASPAPSSATPTLSSGKQPVTQSESLAQQIAIQAYVFFYPIVLMDLTRRQQLNKPQSKMNVISNMLAFPPPTYTTVVRPNFDTLYSGAWLDLTDEPIVLTVPDTNGRYYLMPLLDMWTDVFAAPGSRTSGTTAAAFAIVPPGWSGQLPTDVIRIDSPTPYVWLIGRTQTNGVSDYPAVNAIQTQFTLTRLSEWGGATTPFPNYADSSIDMKVPPLVQVNSMTAHAFFTYAADLLKIHPVHVTDWSEVSTFSQIGIVPGKSFNWTSLSPSIQAALQSAVTNALALIKAQAFNSKLYNGWQMFLQNVGTYGNNYVMRAFVAMVGLGANQPQDSLYAIVVKDSNGDSLVAGKCYRLTFSAGNLPPVLAFWSVTMYDALGYPVSNSLDRYALHNWDPLAYNSDGSLTIFIQSNATDNIVMSNWLPSPSSGAIGVTLRLYAPQYSALVGSWTPPPVVPTSDC